MSMYKFLCAHMVLYRVPSPRSCLICISTSLKCVWSMEKMSCHNRLPFSERNHEPCFVSLHVVLCCILDLVDPHGRHYRLSFRSRNRILDIIPHDQLGYFFIAGRICINDVTQQCHITRVYLKPLTFVGSFVILFFILNYLSCPRWSSLLEVDLALSLGNIMILIFF